MRVLFERFILVTVECHSVLPHLPFPIQQPRLLLASPSRTCSHPVGLVCAVPPDAILILSSHTVCPPSTGIIFSQKQLQELLGLRTTHCAVSDTVHSIYKLYVP